MADETESYKYWYASARGALSLLVNNSKISAEKRKDKGRIEAGMHDIDTDYLMEIWEIQEGRCIYSGIPMNYDINEFRVSLDRIDNNKGYVKGNIVLCCQEFNGRSSWTEDKIDEMISILERGITDNPACFDKVFIPRKIYEKQYCTVINGCDHYNCTLCGIVKPRDQFNFRVANGCKECVTKRMQKAKENPRGMIQALLQTAKISANYRKNNSTAYKRDHTFDIDFDFLVELYNVQRGLCAYSGLPMQFGTYKKKDWVMSLERIDPFKGYTRDNVCLICIEFNSADQSVKLKNPAYGSCAWSKDKFELFLAFVKHKNGLLSDEELPKIVANSSGRKMVCNYRRVHVNRPYIRKHDLYTKYRNNKHGQVWKLTSPDNKLYIYSTPVLYQKPSNVLNWIKKYKNRAINDAIKKHGEENIKMEVILTCPNDKHEEFRELMIKEYNTVEPNGLNPKPNKQHTEDTKKGIAHTNKVKAQEKRKGHDGRDLPLYMKFTDRSDRKGYEIVSHPLLKGRFFGNTKKTLEQLYEECISELNKLNSQLASAPAEGTSSEEEPTPPPASELPKGVSYSGNGKKRIKAQIQYNKEVYVLGTFEVNQADEAHQLYLKYRDAIDIEKKGGPKVDFGDIKPVKRK